MRRLLTPFFLALLIGVACAPAPDLLRTLTPPASLAGAGERLPPACAILPPPAAIAQFEQARVARVIDGDTIALADGRRVRYIGVNTPELGSRGRPDQPYAREAMAANQRLVGGATVYLEKDVSETDRFGRFLRYVYVDTTQVNLALVHEGFAQASSYPPDVRYQDCYRAAQREAREARRGLWGPP